MYQPHFTISNKILKNISLIEAAREVINQSPLLPLWERKFQEEAILRTVHHGTHIEGNPLDITEVKKVVEGEKIVARQRDVQEVINYRNVIRFISSFAKEKPSQEEVFVGEWERLKWAQNSESSDSAGGNQEITQKVLKKLHQLTTAKILPPSECGVYRKVQVVVRNSQTGKVTFRPPPAVEVPYLIEEFLSWLNGSASRDLHPVLKAGIAHFEIVRIHPFLDGNGRVARALATLILYKEGYDIRRFFSLEEYYDKNAEEYYRALQSVMAAETTLRLPAQFSAVPNRLPRLRRDALSDSSKIGRLPASSLDERAATSPRPSGDYDLTPWLEYFTLGLAIELTRVKERVQKISQDLALKEKLGGKQIYLSERQIKIVEFIQRAGVLKNKDFSFLFPMISEDTVLRELKDLMKKGIIKKRGKTKAARYVLK